MKHNLGQRICIVGWSSLGKSTLADNLGKKLNLPVVHLDQLKHLPTGNWIARSQEEFEALQAIEIAKDKWVMDGNYTRTMSRRFDRADTIIHIQMNRFGAAYRFVARYLKQKYNIARRVGQPEGVQEKFSWEILWWILQPRFLYPDRRAKAKIFEELLNTHIEKVINIYSFKQANDLVKNVIGK